MSKEALEAKKAVVQEIKSHLENSKSVVFLNYQGINVEQDTTLRKGFREKDVVYKIYKNRLIKIALDEMGITGYDPNFLEGSTAVAFGKDEVAPASVLFKMKGEFRPKDKEFLAPKFGLMGHDIVDATKVEALSKIPPREVLIAQLLGMLNAPVAALARALDAIAKKEA